jgi:hypothetical protein
VIALDRSRCVLDLRLALGITEWLRQKAEALTGNTSQEVPKAYWAIRSLLLGSFPHTLPAREQPVGRIETFRLLRIGRSRHLSYAYYLLVIKRIGSRPG